MLLNILRNSGFGCTILGVFYGAVIYADDIFLLSASRTGLQVMINLCQKFAERINLKFGTNANPDKSKTKCIAFSRKQSRVVLDELKLGEHSLPWVSQIKHLGHTLQTDNSMTIDMNHKRGIFIGKVNSLMQEFHYAAPHVLLRLVHSYACNLYGSNTWDIFSNECQKICTSYNFAVRNIYNLPRRTHRYLLESLTDLPHLYVQLLSRYVTFSKALLSNDALEIRFLASLSVRDMRTVLGRTIAKIADLCGQSSDVSTFNAKVVKKNLKYMALPEIEAWRAGVVKDMMDILNSDSQAMGIHVDEARIILEYACVS